MPSIISKILHRTSRSGSPSPSEPTSPSGTALVAERDREGGSTIRLDDRFDSPPVSPESRRKSMSATSGTPTSPSAPARKSLDGRAHGIYVNPVRPAPPPPVPEDPAHVSKDANRGGNAGANASTVVIDGGADPRHAHGQHETTAAASALPPPPRRSHEGAPAPDAGQFDRTGLFDDTPAASTALDHFSTSHSPSTHTHEHAREAHAPPGPVDLDLDRDLPPLPRNPSHEIKQVDSRRRPTVSDSAARQSVEGELGRESLDAHDRDAHLRRSSDGRGMDRSIEEEEPSRRSTPLADKVGDGAALEIPTRGSSLRHAEANNGEGETIQSEATGQTGVTGTTPFYTPPAESVENKMAGLSIANADKTGNTARGDGQDALEQQRTEMVAGLVDASERSREKRGELSEEGVHTFAAAGMSELVGKESTVDVKTQWLKPVVQETIIPRIHTEYQTIIERETHKHHVYPKIQPIEDPNPIVLPPLHRIFSPATGKWHEVQGDDAAIAILGEDVFRNGPKEVRHARRPVTDDLLRRESGDVSLPAAQTDASTVVPATQAGKARVVEREGILGEEMGEWKKTEIGQLFGKPKDEVGAAM